MGHKSRTHWVVTSNLCAKRAKCKHGKTGCKPIKQQGKCVNYENKSIPKR